MQFGLIVQSPRTCFDCIAVAGIPKQIGRMLCFKMGIAEFKGIAEMKNVEMKVEGNTLIIRVDLTKEFGPSSSGKTIIIASTEGNQSVPDKDGIKIGLNIYKMK